MKWYPSNLLASKTATTLLKASKDECGTVAGLVALSQALDDLHDDGMFSENFQMQ